MLHDALYVCEDCGTVFTEPKQTHNGGYWEEPWNECPHCGSTNFEIADACDICGDVHPVKDMEFCICKDCLEKKVQEHAVEYIKQDVSLMSDFAWWIHSGLRRKQT